jgi:cystathionine beta-lyase
MNKKDFKTLCVHEGEIKDIQFKGSTSPLYMSTSYAFNDVDIKQYPRYFNTPNQRGLIKKISSLESAETGLIFSSGMAAISTSLLSNLNSEDHLIIQGDIYGGTRNFIKKEFSKYNIEFSFTKDLTIQSFQEEIKKNTKGVFIETPSNPLLKIVDLKEIGLFAKSNNLWSMIDNTFASPVNQNPILFGIDIVIHSATKYLGGHSDICAGVVVSEKKNIDKIFQSAKNLGGNLSDYTVWLLERSIKTLYLRVKAQNNNALKLANFLDSQDWVDKVYYPGLNCHPGHEIAKIQMKGFGGMLTFDLNKNLEVEKFLNSLKIIKPSMSLAGVESTALSPKLTSHELLSDFERKEQGINDQMIRFSTGIEFIDDLKNDLLQAVKKSL